MPYKNLDKALLLRNQVFCLKFENFDELQLLYSSINLAETSHTFPTYHCLKMGVCNFFNFIQILSYFQKIKKTWFLHTRFCTFINNSKSKQNKENATHSFVDITKQKTCVKFQQKKKKKKSMVVGARQSFQFFRQKTWCRGNNRGLPYLGIRFCIT